MNHYWILGIPEDADEETTRRAFRALARRYHPDAGAGSSPDKFRRIVEAYEVLRDPVRRATYDASLRVEHKRERRMRAEPLRPEQIRVEPLRPRSGPEFSRTFVFSDPFAELFDEMFRVFEDDLLGGFRFRW